MHQFGLRVSPPSIHHHQELQKLHAELGRARPPPPCQEACFLRPPKTRTPAAQALTERDRKRHLPGGALEEGPWRVPGGERGQTWACTAPGWHPTATASAGAPALGRRGGLGPARPLKPNWVRRTRRGRTRAGRTVPPCATLRRAPSQPLQSRCPPRALSALGARTCPQGAPECRHLPQGGRGGTWGWIRGQEGILPPRPPLVTGWRSRNGWLKFPRFGDFGGTSGSKLT